MQAFLWKGVGLVKGKKEHPRVSLEKQQAFFCFQGEKKTPTTLQTQLFLTLLETLEDTAYICTPLRIAQLTRRRMG